MPIRSLCNKGQSGELTQQARRGPIDQADQEEQEHSAVKAHHQIQTQPISRVETPLQKIRENQEHIKHNRLHGVEPHIPTEIGVPDNNEVKREEHQNPIKREALEHPYSRNQRLNQSLDRSELRDDVFAVLNAVEERVEVSNGRD